MDTKIKKQGLQISTAAFVTTLIPQIIRAVLSSLIRTIPFDMGSYQLVMLITYINALIVYVIAPLLVFVVFYFIGKKPELKLELQPILLALLIGFLTSFFIASIVYSIMAMEMTVVYILGIALQYIMTFFVAHFLAALAGLSIGYFKRKKLTPTTEPELS